MLVLGQRKMGQSLEHRAFFGVMPGYVSTGVGVWHMRPLTSGDLHQPRNLPSSQAASLGPVRSGFTLPLAQLRRTTCALAPMTARSSASVASYARNLELQRSPLAGVVRLLAAPPLPKPCRLPAVPHEACRGLTSLATLNLMANQLAELPDNFGDMRALRLIGLKSNKVQV